MNKKKKMIIIFGALLLSVMMFAGAQFANKSYAQKHSEKTVASSEKAVSNTADADKNKGENEENKTEENKAEEANKVEQGKNQEQKTKDNSKDSSRKTEDGAGKSNDSNKTRSSSSANGQSGSTAPSSSASSGAQNKGKTENKEPNFIILDTVHNKIIMEKHIEDEGITVAALTEKLLEQNDISYRTTGSGATTYFAVIDGLAEKKAGPLSGWCYYVKKNGSSSFAKPNVGTGSWTYHKGDVVVWKYLADGVNE